MSSQFIVVSNTSPIFYVSQIGQLDWLRQLYGQLLIPEAVYQELVVRPRGLSVSNQVRATKWIERHQVRNHAFVLDLRMELDPGEAEAIALAKEIAANLLLIDEAKGRTIAVREGSDITGILGVLIEAKSKNLIPRVKPLLDELFNTSFRASRQLYERVFRQANE